MSEHIYASDGDHHWLTGEEIVRCRDCEHCEQLPPEKDKQFYRWCYELSRHVTKNEFCSWGERRDA